jgi:hypothetical protein
VLRTPKTRQRLGAAAREKVVRDYSLARANNIFWKIFDQQFVSPGLTSCAQVNSGKQLSSAEKQGLMNGMF